MNPEFSVWCYRDEFVSLPNFCEFSFSIWWVIKFTRYSRSRGEWSMKPALGRFFVVGSYCYHLYFTVVFILNYYVKHLLDGFYKFLWHVFFRKKISKEIWVSLVYSDDIALFLDIWSFGITNIHIVFYKFSMLFFKVFGSLWVGTKYSIPYIRVGNVFGAKLLAPSCSTTPKTIETMEL